MSDDTIILCCHTRQCIFTVTDSVVNVRHHIITVFIHLLFLYEKLSFNCLVILGQNSKMCVRIKM